MKLTLKSQEENVAVFEISHEYGGSQSLTLIYKKNGLSLYMHNSERKLLVNKFFENFKLRAIRFYCFGIDLEPVSLKPNEFINIYLEENQTATTTRTTLSIYGDVNDPNACFHYSTETSHTEDSMQDLLIKVQEGTTNLTEVCAAPEFKYWLYTDNWNEHPKI